VVIDKFLICVWLGIFGFCVCCWIVGLYAGHVVLTHLGF